ncbi:DUF2231 domain-containing protein [Sphingomonas koreensis]|nr:DUF2231 domain-containing protein [Sphingomonas koreensis]
MNDTRLSSDVAIVRHPIHALLVPVPVVCFTGALITDIVYSRTADIQWANFSTWMLFVGIVVAVLAAIAGAIDFRGHRRIRRQGAAWPHAIGNLIVLVLALFNNFVHSRDAWTSVVPTGLILSTLTVLTMLVTVILGRSIRYDTSAGERR